MFPSASVAAPAPLTVDCANGVGAIPFRWFQGDQTIRARLPLLGLNDHPSPGANTLNHRCGAEHVQKTRQPPVGVTLPVDDDETHSWFASIDGDADRVVFFYLTQGSLHLLDGDKITSLVTLFLQDVVKVAGMGSELKVGVVQTAYANGASTHFISGTLGVEVACVPTGVKHLHHVAEEFDIGVYFEANGHGTVLINPTAQTKMQSKLTEVLAFNMASATPQVQGAMRVPLSHHLRWEKHL